MNTLNQDARYALRTMARSPLFTAVAVFTLAIGIGANTAIFTVINALMLRPLAFAEPHRLAVLSSDRAGDLSRGGPLSWLRFEQIRDHNRAFSGVAAYWDEVFSLTGRGGDAEEIKAARVSWNFFDVLGVAPAVGRTFLPEEDKTGGENVVIVSHSLAARLSGAATLTLDGKSYTVIGVLPTGFRFGMLGPDIEIYAPRIFELNAVLPRQVQGGAMFLNAVARLGPGVTFRQAQEEMAILAGQYRESHAGFPDADPLMSIAARDLRDEMIHGVRTALLILAGAVGLVLLIACANVASLLLSRAIGRQREIAVRTALGATRGSLIRQLLTESLILSLTGGILGTLLGTWATRMVTTAGATLPRAAEIHADASVLAFTLAISVLSGVLFGLVPALQVSRADLNTVLRSEGRSATSGPGRNRLRGLLAVAQVALSMVLLIGAGLLVRSFVQIRGARPGFAPRNLLTMNVTLPAARYPRAQIASFFLQLAADVRTLPGVVSASTASALPANPSRRSPALPEDQPPVPMAERPTFHIQTVAPGYVETMRIPLLAGREFTERDQARTPLVVMVNDTLARRYWPGGNAAGKHIVIGLIATPMEIVGVIGDVRNESLSTDARPEIYLPLPQLPVPSMTLLVRTSSDPHGMVSAVRGRILALDRELPVTAVRTMEEVLESAASEPRFTMSLLSALSAVALILALVGIYGVIAYSVSERTQEMGIRMALGAARADILRLVLRQALALAAVGISIGVGASLFLTRMMTTLLYRVSATDLLTFIAAPLSFGAVALLAGYLPASKATRVDPMTALRYE